MSRFTTLKEWLAWIETNHTTAIDLGLERISQVRDKLGIDFSQQTVITEAGTTGKGSCVTVMEQLLAQSGISVGSFTSPHFIRFNERIRGNQHLITDAELIRLFNEIDNARGDTTLSYFEFSALAALLYSYQQQFSVVLLEVGLGGRLDAVNCIDADIAIVTSIALDHQDWLGDTVEQIAVEKCGIFRSGRYVVSGLTEDDPAAQVIADYAQAISTTLLQKNKHFGFAPDGFYCVNNKKSPPKTQKNLVIQLPQLPVNSIACALQALALTEYWPSLKITAISDTQLIGRWQQVCDSDLNFILDVAHNPAAAKNLSSQLQQYPIKGKTVAIFAAMADKDINNIIAAVKDNIDHWYLIPLVDNARAAKPENILTLVKNQYSDAKVSISASMDAAIAAIKTDYSLADRVIVFGSFHTVSAFLTYFGE